MTPLEYRAALATLGMTSPAFARAAGIPRRTAANYAEKTPCRADLAEWLRRAAAARLADPVPRR